MCHLTEQFFAETGDQCGGLENCGKTPPGNLQVAAEKGRRVESKTIIHNGWGGER